MKDLWNSIPPQIQLALVGAATLIIGAISEAVLTYIDSLNPGV